MAQYSTPSAITAMPTKQYLFMYPVVKDLTGNSLEYENGVNLHVVWYGRGISDAVLRGEERRYDR